MSEIRPRNFQMPDMQGQFLRGLDVGRRVQTDPILPTAPHPPTNYRDSHMATLEAAKLSYLHKKVLERYLEAPTADDEEILKLMDLQNTRPAATYQGMGHQEHPVYARDRWLSEAAAKLTDEGYWVWVTKQINNNVGYRFSGDMIVEIARPSPGWGDHASEAAMPSPFFTNTEHFTTLLNTPLQAGPFEAPPPQQPRPTRARQVPGAPVGFMEVDPAVYAATDPNS